MSKNILILAGNSCSGKSRIENKLSLLGFGIIDISTTRKKRDDDGDNYIFISNEMSELIMGDSITPWYTLKTKVGNYHYPLTNLGYKDNYVISIIDCKPIYEYKKLLEENGHTVSVIEITRPSKEVRECLEKRGYTKDEINFRLSRSSECTNQIDSSIFYNLLNTFIYR